MTRSSRIYWHFPGNFLSLGIVVVHAAAFVIIVGNPSIIGITFLFLFLQGPLFARVVVIVRAAKQEVHDSRQGIETHLVVVGHCVDVVLVLEVESPWL